MSKIRLYHVTPQCNFAQIRRQGVTTRFATGRRKASYWVKMEALPWAIAHCSRRHGVLVHKLTVCVAEIPEDQLKATGLPGVFYCEMSSVDVLPLSVSAVSILDSLEKRVTDVEREIQAGAHQMNDNARES